MIYKINWLFVGELSFLHQSILPRHPIWVHICSFSVSQYHSVAASGQHVPSVCIWGRRSSTNASRPCKVIWLSETPIEAEGISRKDVADRSCLICAIASYFLEPATLGRTNNLETHLIPIREPQLLTFGRPIVSKFTIYRLSVPKPEVSVIRERVTDYVCLDAAVLHCPTSGFTQKDSINVDSLSSIFTDACSSPYIRWQYKAFY